ncbi:hypothetical protein LTR66_007581 [Elasticomyces elasticus]|nr:hypothetical protein LTR66_007581 [Elasticomyces elasticus]
MAYIGNHRSSTQRRKLRVELVAFHWPSVDGLERAKTCEREDEVSCLRPCSFTLCKKSSRWKRSQTLQNQNKSMFRTTSIQYNCGHYEVKEGALRNCAHDGESRSPPATSAYIKFDWACLSCTESMSPEELMKRDKQDRTDEQEALIPVPVPVHVLVGEVQPTTELPAAKEIDNTDAAERRAQEIIMAHDDKQAHDVGSTSTEPSSLADNHERPPSPKPPPPGWLLTWLEKASHEELQMRESVLESNEGYSEANPPSTCDHSSTVDDKSAGALHESPSIEPRPDLTDHGEELHQIPPSHEDPLPSDR